MKSVSRFSGYSFIFWILMFSYIFIFMFISGCAKVNKIDKYSEKEKIEKVINTSIGWALNKDTALLFSMMSQDSNLFIFHPDSASTVIGFENFKKQSGFWLNPKFKATDFKVKNLRIDISNSGTVAWYSCNLDDHALWGEKQIGWDNVRWTGVLEKKNENWVIMQMHFSFPK